MFIELYTKAYIIAPRGNLWLNYNIILLLVSLLYTSHRPNQENYPI